MCVSHAGLSKTPLPLYNEKDAILSKIIGKNSVLYFTHITKKKLPSVFITRALSMNEGA